MYAKDTNCEFFRITPLLFHIGLIYTIKHIIRIINNKCKKKNKNTLEEKKIALNFSK